MGLSTIPGSKGAVDLSSLARRVTDLETLRSNDSLLTNGDFENWPSSGAPNDWNTGWTAGNPVVTKDETVSYRGARSVKITMDDTGDFQRIQSTEMRVAPGDILICRMAVRGSSAAACQFGFTLLTNDVNNNAQFFAPGCGSQDSGWTLVSAANTWQEVAVTYVIPASHVKATINLNAQGLINGAFSYWIDFASVRAYSPTVLTTNDTGWIAPTLLSSWVNYGGSFASAGYRRLNGVVYLRGLIKNGLTSASNICILPTGFRTSGQHLWEAPNSGGVTRIDVGSDGSVSIQGAVTGTLTNSWQSLAGIQYIAEG